MYVKVRVTPGMRKESVTKTAPETYEIVTRVAAARNQANVRVQELIADLYGVEKGRVRMVTGHRSPKKVFEVDTN